MAPRLPSEPIKGRVYVFLGPDGSTRRAESRARTGFDQQPFFAVDVENWKPGEPLRIDSRSDGFPGRLDELEPGRYAIQAVVRRNLDTHKIGDGEGNVYGPVVHARLDPK